MTVAEAIEVLRKLPPGADLMMDGETGPYGVESFREAKWTVRRAGIELEYNDLSVKGQTVVVVW